MKTETKRGHKTLNIIGIILLILFSVGVIFFIKGKIHERRPWYDEDYFDDFKTDAVLEKKYSARGSFETAYTEFKSDNNKIDTIRVFYPAELADSNRSYPMIVSVNASGTRARNYTTVLDRIASWGFIVVGNDDPQSGTGETASQTLDFILHIGTDSELYGKIDKNNIGIMGYSQGGAGALCAVTNFDNGKLYKTIFTGSAAYPFLAHNMGWDYDVSKVTIPYFMTSGTGKTDDAGVPDITKDFAGVCPLEAVITNYNSISDDVEKVRARAAGAEHEDMLVRSDGYMTAWMLYQLCGDEDAAKVFVGDDAEILHNSNWQDIEKND